MLSESLGEHRKARLQKIPCRSVLTNQLGEKPAGLCSQTFLKEKPVLGIELAVRGGLIEAVEFKPLIGEIFDETGVLGIVEQPVYLGMDDFRAGQGSVSGERQ